jgi:hypothetical protein
MFCCAVPAPPGREPSTPFISGDTFRFFADFVFDEVDESLDPMHVKKGSTVFVKTDYLNAFFEKVHPKIQEPYILITHNSDDAAPGPFSSHLNDPNIIAWFAQNYDGFPHPKIHPIPIGLANYHWPHGNFKAVEKVRSKSLPKEHLVYMNLTAQTYPLERQLVINLFKGKSFCFQGKNKKYPLFLTDLKASKFVFAPRGNGLDTHRLWESLLVGSIPIVKSSPLDSLYEGLPVLVVQDWNEVTEEFLQQKEIEIGQKPHFPERLLIDYWLKLIVKERAQ